jgi:hypothetical protein
MPDCTCPRIIVGRRVTETRTWGETCAEHGVGTTWFREHPVPYGYADVADWTREQFLAWLEGDEGDD